MRSPTAAFTTRDVAEVYGRSVYGQMYVVTEMRVRETWTADDGKKQLREQGLAKLTKEERAALGF